MSVRSRKGKHGEVAMIGEVNPNDLAKVILESNQTFTLHKDLNPKIPEGYIELICRRCPACNNEHSVIVKEEDVEKFEQGMLVQRAFPYLSSDDRETILSGLSKECYTKYFGSDEE